MWTISNLTIKQIFLKGQNDKLAILCIDNKVICFNYFIDNNMQRVRKIIELDFRL